jgi:hypothetical protein
MTTRNDFAQRLSNENLTHWERAVAFLWYYRQSQEFEERTAAELAEDMSEEGFPHAHITRLRDSLIRTPYAVRGRRANSFRLNLRYLPELTERFSDFLAQQSPAIQDAVLPAVWVVGTRAYLENMVLQINGCYQFSFYDGCAVLARRLMESLIVEIYISQGRAAEIKNQGTFLQLDGLIAHVCNDPAIQLARNSPGIMHDLKALGDTAAHDRVYITHQLDIDDFKPRLRRLIRELLSISGIRS